MYMFFCNFPATGNEKKKNCWCRTYLSRRLGAGAPDTQAGRASAGRTGAQAGVRGAGALGAGARRVGGVGRAGSRYGTSAQHGRWGTKGGRRARRGRRAARALACGLGTLLAKAVHSVHSACF